MRCPVYFPLFVRVSLASVAVYFVWALLGPSLLVPSCAQWWNHPCWATGNTLGLFFFQILKTSPVVQLFSGLVRTRIFSCFFRFSGFPFVSLFFYSFGVFLFLFLFFLTFSFLFSWFCFLFFKKYLKMACYILVVYC